MIIIKGGVTYAYLQSVRLSGHEPESSEYLICTGHHETKLCPGVGHRFHTDRRL